MGQLEAAFLPGPPPDSVHGLLMPHEPHCDPPAPQGTPLIQRALSLSSNFAGALGFLFACWETGACIYKGRI